MPKSLATGTLTIPAGLAALATGLWDRLKRPERDCCPGVRTQSKRSENASLVRSPLTVKIERDAFAALRCYVKAVPGELTLLGTAQTNAQRDEIRVDQLLLPYQRSSASHTEVGEEALARLLVEASRRGIDTARIRVWMHSHGEISAFFSSTDDQCIETAFPQADWVLSLVTNRAGQMKARLSLYRPFRLDVDDLPVSVGPPGDLEEAIRREVAQKVHQGYGHRAVQPYPAGCLQTCDSGSVRQRGIQSVNPCADYPRNAYTRGPAPVGD
jgi:hypothetical protein